MNNSLSLPFIFLKFWYWEAPAEMFGYFASLNDYSMQLLSLPLCLKTYFQPLKNEYREGLVGFSRAMGMLIKTGLILADLVIFAALIILEGALILSFLIFPALTIMLWFL